MNLRSNRYTITAMVVTLLLTLTLMVQFLTVPVAADGGGSCSGSYVGSASCRNGCQACAGAPGFYKCWVRQYNVLVNPLQYQVYSASWGPSNGCFLGTGSCPGFCN